MYKKRAFAALLHHIQLAHFLELYVCALNLVVLPGAELEPADRDGW